MQRKLVKQGASTLMVSLPSKWCKAQTLGKGSVIELVEQGHDLVLSTSAIAAKQGTKIAYKSIVESAVRSPLVNAYRRGYDKIEITYSDSRQFKIVQELVRTRLIGFEITKHEGNTLTVENITEPTSEQFDVIFRKIFQNIHALFKSTAKRFAQESDAEPYEEIEERINKYENFCRRLLAKGHTEQKPEMLIFITLVTHGQREIYHANKAWKDGTKISKMTMHALQGIEELFNLLERAYFEKSIEAIEKLHQRDKTLFYGELYELLSASKGKETIIAYHLTAGARKFFQANSPLTALIL